MLPLRSTRRGTRGGFGVFLLIAQLLQTGLDRIPPVTLGTIALNVSIYLGVLHRFLNRNVPSLGEVCIGVRSVWYQQDYKRLLKGAFFHGDDWHLYFNMASFMYKGIYLEKKVGSRWFLYMLVVFTACTNVVLLYLDYAFAFLLNDQSYLRQCAVGFSGVIFAVKVVTTHMMPEGTSLVMGYIPVNSRLACWFELVVIQLLVPNASFTGHLAGILVGLAYVNGPLKMIMEFVPNMLRPSRRRLPRSGRSYTYRAGTAANGGPHRTESFTRFTGGLNEEEQMDAAVRQSMQESHNYERVYPDLQSNIEPTAPPAPPVPNGPEDAGPGREELRRRRLQRFNN